MEDIKKLKDENKRLTDALLAIYNIDAMFMLPNGEDREYDYKEAHDVMLKEAEEALRDYHERERNRFDELTKRPTSW